MIQSIMESLSHQYYVANIIFDALLRRGILQCSELVKWLLRPKHSNESVCSLDISNLGTNIWMWQFFQTAVDRSLDIARAAVTIRNKTVTALRSANSMDMDSDTPVESARGGKDMSGMTTLVVEGKAPTQEEEQRRLRLAEATAAGREFQEDDDDGGSAVIGARKEVEDDDEERVNEDSRRNRFQSVNNSEEVPASVSSALSIPEAISESVLGAADVCREIYKDLLSQLLFSYSARWAHLQTSNPLEASLDPHIVSYTSLALFVKRIFSLTNKVLQDNIVSSGGLLPDENLFSIVNNDDVIAVVNERRAAGLELFGPAAALWEREVNF